jgi:mannose-1-phosphate guanylyltransferase/mannose-6-phosphate isomerase
MRPKQFIPLVGERSPFQATLVRLSQLAGAAPPLVVAGLGHAGWIEREADQAGVSAEVLLEPVARESAPAVAAAAAWIARHDPNGVAVIVASDHHIPDDDAFLKAVETAGVAASQGWVVTLGVDPTGPATAYGYIQPGELLAGAAPVRRNQAFVEKPDVQTAAAHLRAGYLWNSGNFIARADVLLEELDRYQPEISAAARAAVESATPSSRGWRLGPVFASAPKISLDYAVMERTDRAAVLPVSFVWSDLGAWDAVWAASSKDENGNAAPPDVLLQGARDCLVRTSGALQVALVGASRLAVIADDRALLICDLDSSQGVKAVAEAAARGPSFGPADPPTLSGWAERYDRWFRTAALPAWWALGGDHVHGGFYELVGLDGAAPSAPKRARVQARQTFVYAQAARLGLAGPWRQAAEHGWRFFEQHYRRPDGLFRTLVTPQGEALDETAYLYDQAFALMALAALHQVAADRAHIAASAQALLAAIRRHFAHPAGGYREAGAHPFQANPLMHLLEAAMAWVEVGGGEVWLVLARELVDLALSRFIDSSSGFLGEYFDAEWRPAAGDLGQLVDTGHQFEWAWLLDRWAHMVDEPAAAAVARDLYQAGLAGWDHGRGVLVDELNADRQIRRATARLWPQTEMLKASITLGRDASGDHAAYTQHALEAADGLWRYLDTSVAGLWRDRMGADGQFKVEPAPASSFYHLVGAILALRGYHKDGETDPGAPSVTTRASLAASVDLEPQR